MIHLLRVLLFLHWRMEQHFSTRFVCFGLLGLLQRVVLRAVAVSPGRTFFFRRMSFLIFGSSVTFLPLLFLLPMAGCSMVGRTMLLFYFQAAVTAALCGWLDLFLLALLMQETDLAPQAKRWLLVCNQYWYDRNFSR